MLSSSFIIAIVQILSYLYKEVLIPLKIEYYTTCYLYMLVMRYIFYHFNSKIPICYCIPHSVCELYSVNIVMLLTQEINNNIPNFTKVSLVHVFIKLGILLINQSTSHCVNEPWMARWFYNSLGRSSSLPQFPYLKQHFMNTFCIFSLLSVMIKMMKINQQPEIVFVESLVTDLFFSLHFE